MLPRASREPETLQSAASCDRAAGRTKRHLPFLDSAIFAKDHKRPAEKVAACAVMTFPVPQVRVRLLLPGRRDPESLHAGHAGGDCRADRRPCAHDGDHFVARADPAGLQSEVERIGAGSHAHRMRHSYICGEVLLEPLDLPAKGECAALDNNLQSGLQSGTGVSPTGRRPRLEKAERAPTIAGRSVIASRRPIEQSSEPASAGRRHVRPDQASGDGRANKPDR